MKQDNKASDVATCVRALRIALKTICGKEKRIAIAELLIENPGKSAKEIKRLLLEEKGIDMPGSTLYENLVALRAPLFVVNIKGRWYPTNALLLFKQAGGDIARQSKARKKGEIFITIGPNGVSRATR